MWGIMFRRVRQKQSVFRISAQELCRFNCSSLRTSVARDCQGEGGQRRPQAHRLSTAMWRPPPSPTPPTPTPTPSPRGAHRRHTPPSSWAASSAASTGEQRATARPRVPTAVHQAATTCKCHTQKSARREAFGRSCDHQRAQIRSAARLTSAPRSCAPTAPLGSSRGRDQSQRRAWDLPRDTEHECHLQCTS